MVPITELELVGRLVLATLLGFLIGLEREFAGQPAGERTHALAALGSATFALISMTVFPGSDLAEVVCPAKQKSHTCIRTNALHINLNCYLSEGD
jgi:uncharacterized membrane protein YhiD involved in acid resistance